MPMDPSARKPGEDWIAIVRKNGMPEFAAAFAANPVLHTSVMSGPCVGVEAVAAVFAATAISRMKPSMDRRHTSSGKAKPSANLSAAPRS